MAVVTIKQGVTALEQTEEGQEQSAGIRTQGKDFGLFRGLLVVIPWAAALKTNTTQYKMVFNDRITYKEQW